MGASLLTDKNLNQQDWTFKKREPKYNSQLEIMNLQLVHFS